MHTAAQDSDFFRDRVFAECEIWGAVDAAVIGIIAFRKGWIDQLYILPDRQGQGAGGALLAIAKAAYGDLQLWTFQRNAGARRFYEKHGFLATLETDGSRNDEREPDMLYRWQRPAAG
jgi:putative acetyltransferase